MSQNATLWPQKHTKIGEKVAKTSKNQQKVDHYSFMEYGSIHAQAGIPL